MNIKNCFTSIVMFILFAACSARGTSTSETPIANSSVANSPSTSATSTSIQLATKVSYSVTGNADGAPMDCSPDQIASRISEAFHAINRADPDVVDKYFGRADYAPFGWYMIGNSDEQFAAYTWRTLDEYFQERFQQHEHIELRSIRVNGWEQERGLVHFGPIEIARTADDLGESERIYRGKGAYYCKTHTIVVLGLGEYDLP